MSDKLKEALKDTTDFIAREAVVEEAIKTGEYVRKSPRNAIKSVDKENYTIDFTITTDTVDRDSERVVPKCFESTLELYKANPIVLWAHNPIGPAVAQAIDFQVSDKEFNVRDKFAVDEYEFAATLWKLYSADPPYMRAVSVGFIPIKASNEAKDKLEGQMGRTFLEAELIEHSLVGVGSNRLALSKALKGIYSQTKGVWDEAYTRTLVKLIEQPSDLSCGHKAWYGMDGEVLNPCPICEKGSKLSALLNRVINNLEDDENSRSDIIASMADEAGIKPSTVNQILSEDIDCPPLERLEGFARALGVSLERLRSAAEKDGCKYVKTITVFADLPTAPINTPWRWNASAGNKILGDDDKPDWKRYRKAHIYVDPDSTSTKDGYKLPIARMFDDELQVVWRAVRAAMGALFGARGGVDIPDGERRSAYNHLAKYYEKFDKEAPEYRVYSDEEIQKLFSDEEEIIEKGTGLVKKMMTTFPGSYERDMRDIHKALQDYKKELMAMGMLSDHDEMDDDVEKTSKDMERMMDYMAENMWVDVMAHYPGMVICHCPDMDMMYKIDWSRDEHGMVMFENPKVIEPSFEVRILTNSDTKGVFLKEEAKVIPQSSGAGNPKGTKKDGDGEKAEDKEGSLAELLDELLQDTKLILS